MARARRAASSRDSAVVTTSTPARFQAAFARRERRRGDRLRVAARARRARSATSPMRDPAGKFGERRGERSLKLKCSFTVAAAVEVGAGAQRQLLAGQRPRRGPTSAPRAARPGGAWSGGRLGRLGRRQLLRRRSIRPSASWSPLPFRRARPARGSGVGRVGSAEETRWAARNCARRRRSARGAARPLRGIVPTGLGVDHRHARHGDGARRRRAGRRGGAAPRPG